MRHFALPLALLYLALPLAAQPSGSLNDTGQILCYDDTTTAACTSSSHPRQDGRFGRDRAGMAKVGGGAAGFDFTKICWNGTAEGSGSCTGTLVANTGASASATPATDWACTKDNHTQLIWSLQTVSSINWANANSTAGGSPIAAHNTANRCGFSTGWRVPTRRELLSIVHHGFKQSGKAGIDLDYFPGTQSNFYWSSDRYARGLPDSDAWVVYFDGGLANTKGKTNAFHVRLVRSEP